MSSEHAEIWLQAPPPPIRNFDSLVEQQSPDYSHDKSNADDLLLLGMMLYMQQGLILEWLHPGQEKEVEEDRSRNTARQP